MNQPLTILPTKGDIIVMARNGFMQYAVFIRRSHHRVYFMCRDPNAPANSKLDPKFLVSWIQKSPHYSIDERFLVISIDQVLDPEIKDRLLNIQKVVQDGFHI